MRTMCTNRINWLRFILEGVGSSCLKDLTGVKHDQLSYKRKWNWIIEETTEFTPTCYASSHVTSITSGVIYAISWYYRLWRYLARIWFQHHNWKHEWTENRNALGSFWGNNLVSNISIRSTWSEAHSTWMVMRWNISFWKSSPSLLVFYLIHMICCTK